MYEVLSSDDCKKNTKIAQKDLLQANGSLVKFSQSTHEAVTLINTMVDEHIKGNLLVHFGDVGITEEDP